MGHAVARDLSPCTSHTHTRTRTHAHTHIRSTERARGREKAASKWGREQRQQPDRRRRRRSNHGETQTGRDKRCVWIGPDRMVLMDDGWDMAGRMDHIDVHTASISIIILSVLPYLYLALPLPHIRYQVRSTDSVFLCLQTHLIILPLYSSFGLLTPVLH